MNILSLSIAGFLLLTLQLFVTAHIILHKEDVPSAIGWTGLVWLAPIVGSIAYILLGINRVKRKAIRLHNRGTDILTLTGKTAKEIEASIPAPLWQLLRLGYKTHPQHLALGNKLCPLTNGDEAYPRMCQTIAAATQEVLIASYIFNNDRAGKMFIPALEKAVQNGAKVRMLIDGVGLNYSNPNIFRAVRKIKGLEFAVFLPSKSPINLPFVNLRNHRKMMIIDGKKAYFGGMNVSEGNLLHLHPKQPIQDVTFEVQGPVLQQMARLFKEDWTFCTRKPFSSVAARESKKHENIGTTAARILPDGPDADYGKIEQMCLGALECAQKSAAIVTPYFLPENNILSALETAAKRGVKIEIILPKKSNIWGMDWAMQANFKRLLKADIHLYLASEPFDHSKIFLVDDVWLFAGSANWDVRSFKLNFESNIECFDPDLAQQVRQIIERKIKKSVFVQKTDFDRLSLAKTLRNNLLRLLTPYY
ncbi:phospholipase D-like domain-containing protein [Candidatus Avelusimicrobium sp.]